MASTDTERVPRASHGGSLSPTSPTRSASSSNLLQCVCGRTFTRVENLRRHQRSHEDSRRLACSICSRAFNRPDVLKRHLRTHRGPSASRSGDSPPRTGHSSSATTVPSLSAGTRQTSSASSPPENELPPAHFSYSQEDGHRRHRGDLPSIESLVPGAGSFDVNPPRSRIPLSFPVDALLKNNWDDSLLWILQDTALDLPWRDFAALENAIPASTDPSSGFSFLEALQGSSSHGRSRYSDDGMRPTNSYPSRRPYVPGVDGRIIEVIIDPAVDPKLWPWSRFWLNDALYARVKASLNTIPVHDFHMPESLFTVNTLISEYFTTFYPQLPVIHLSTFSVEKATPLLLAAIIALGASTSKIPGSRPFAVDLIEIIRRTLTNVFESDPVNERNPDLAHACLINTAAALYVGHRRSFELAELSRTRLIQLCRKMQLLYSPPNSQQLYSSLPSHPSELWQVWIDMESRKRLGLAIFLIDSMFPSFLDSPSYLPLGELLNTALPCDDRFWTASSPEEWTRLVGHSVLPPSTLFATGASPILINSFRSDPFPARHRNHFGSLCLITALHHYINEFRSQFSVYQSMGAMSTLSTPNDSESSPSLNHGFDGRRLWLEGALDAWRDDHYDARDRTSTSISGKVLYHLGHISLRIHLRDLYAVSGKIGTPSALAVVPALKAWVRSAEAPIAAEHAVRLLAAVGFPNASENRLAVPGVFVAVLVLWAFLKYDGAAIHYRYDTSEIMHLFGSIPSAYSILKGGLKYMVNNKAWKLGSAFAMVLAQMVDRDEAASPHILSPCSTRSL